MESLVEEAMESEDENTVEDKESVDNQDEYQKGMSEEEIDDIVSSLETNISVIGCGGGGCNTVDRIYSEGISGAELVAVNTDAQDLQECSAESKLLVGKETCKGRGAGSVPNKGRQSAEEDIDEIEKLVEDQDMVFITAGMGGGTGTGVAPVVAEKASEYALTISIVTTPFSAEGKARMDNATGGLKKLKSHSDTVIVVPNDKLLDFAPDLPLQKAFKLADEVLMRSVKGITELITKPSLVNLDFADVKTVMEGGGVAMIGLGESNNTEGAEDSILEALESPLLDINISDASNVLVNVTGGENMQVDEAQGVVQLLNSRVSDEARIIWGAGVDENLQSKVRTMVVITGVSSPQIFGQEDQIESESVEDSITVEEDQETSSIDYVE